MDDGSPVRSLHPELLHRHLRRIAPSVAQHRLLRLGSPQRRGHPRAARPTHAFRRVRTLQHPRAVRIPCGPFHARRVDVCERPRHDHALCGPVRVLLRRVQRPGCALHRTNIRHQGDRHAHRHAV